MTSNGNIFRVTGPLCGEFTGHRWIPITKASDVELWFFSLICAWTNVWVNNQDVGNLGCHCAHYDVTVMSHFLSYWTKSFHWNLCVVITPTWPPLLLPVVVIMKASGATSDDKFAIMKTLSFQCLELLHQSFGGNHGCPTLLWHHNGCDGVSNHCLLSIHSGTDQRKHQGSASLAFVRGIHRSPVNSPYKWPVMRKMFPFDDVIMIPPSLTNFLWKKCVWK